MKRLRAATRKLAIYATACVAFTLPVLLGPSVTETAVANGDTRTIHLFHTHTGESIDATFRVDGRYDQAVLDKLNYFLRDWRNNDQIRMDPRLFDTVWEAYRTAGADQPIQIYSAYRSPETNAMLRRRSRAVAEHSQHMLGKAMDTTMPGMSMERIREIGMRMQHGGVGYYQSANFVHLDVGGVRSWPRMGYDQLARLFPDGKTVHIPANGQPMARYEEARLEIAARGGTEVPPAQESQGFFAWLFGGSGNGAAHEDEGDRMAVASRAPARAQMVAYASPEGDEGAANGRPSARKVDIAAPVAEEATPQPTLAVASLEADEAPRQAAGRDDAAVEQTDLIPLPPRRPADLIAVATFDLPLPPVRPDARPRVAAVEGLPTPMARPGVMPDAIGGLIGASLSRAALPSIITQGSDLRRAPAPMPALAYAGPEATASLRPTMVDVGPRAAPIARAAPAARVVPRAGIVALREDRRIAASAVTSAPVVGAPAALPGASIYGLRRAARTSNASL